MKILWALVILVIGSSYAYGETETCEECPVSNVQIGGNYTYANIKVESQSCFHGNLGGVQGSYEYRPSNGFYGGLRASWKEGKTENSHADRFLTYVDVQERLGYSYTPCCQNWTVTLFSGFGYRYLGHQLKQNDSSIKFRYNEFYVPVGILADYYFNSCFSLGLNCTWMPQVYPTVEIVPLKGAHWTLRNTLSNVLVELPLTFIIPQWSCFSVIFKPFYEHWQDGRSTAKTSTGNELDLPSNNYNFYGAEINFAFSF